MNPHVCIRTYVPSSLPQKALPSSPTTSPKHQYALTPRPLKHARISTHTYAPDTNLALLSTYCMAIAVLAIHWMGT